MFIHTMTPRLWPPPGTNQTQWITMEKHKTNTHSNSNSNTYTQRNTHCNTQRNAICIRSAAAQATIGDHHHHHPIIIIIILSSSSYHPHPTIIILSSSSYHHHPIIILSSSCHHPIIILASSSDHHPSIIIPSPCHPKSTTYLGAPQSSRHRPPGAGLCQQTRRAALTEHHRTTPEHSLPFHTTRLATIRSDWDCK